MRDTADSPEHYNIAELASLGGVTRRTVRYYVQRGLLPVPTGTGRGSHYTKEHLEALIRIRRLQEQGVALSEIERQLSGEPDLAPEAPQAPAPLGESWRKLRVADGLELHVRQPQAFDETTTHRIVDAIRDALLARNKEEEP